MPWGRPERRIPDAAKSRYEQSLTDCAAKYDVLIMNAKYAHRDYGYCKLEADNYEKARAVCEEIMNMASASAPVKTLWQTRRDECLQKCKEVLDQIAPEPVKPVPKPAPKPTSEPVQTIEIEKAVPVKPSTSKKNQAGETETETGFTTRNASKYVPAEDIERWFKKDKPLENGMEAVSGMTGLKERLNKELLDSDWPRIDNALGIDLFRGYLLYGPAGTGKTHIVEAVTSELMDRGFRFISLEGGQIMNQYPGVAEKIVSAIFQEAIDKAPCVIFIDEFEGICASRTGDIKSYEKRITTAFLTGFGNAKKSGKQILFFGATNCPSDVDFAMNDRLRLMRVPLPDEEARVAFFQQQFKNLQLEDGFGYEDVSDATDNYSYRDLERLRDDLLMSVRDQVVEDHKVLNPEGELDREQTDILGSDAVVTGRVRMTRDMFETAIKGIKPQDKTEIRKKLMAFEAGKQGGT